MKAKSTLVIVFLILAYCVWNAVDFVQGWIQNSYFEKYSWVLFMVWCMPIVYYWILLKQTDKNSFQVNSILLGMALLFSLIGNLGELHTFQLIGLALALAAFVPWSWVSFIWIVASFIWMPGSSWIASHLIPHYIEFIFIIRLIIVSLASFGLILKLRSENFSITRHEDPPL